MPREHDDACTDTSFRSFPRKRGASELRARFLESLSSQTKCNTRAPENGVVALRLRNASICPEMTVSARALQPLRKR
jgi:hypothetical protein